MTEPADPGAHTWVPPGGEPVRHPPLVWILASVIVITLLVGGIVAIARGANGYYVFQPGTAPQITNSPQCRTTAGGADLVFPTGTPCALLSVPAGKSHAISGSLSMVDVLVGPATPYQYILSKLGLLHRMDEGSELYPKVSVLGTTPASQLTCQDNQQMVGATSTASVVALNRLGYAVKEDDLGAQLEEVVPGTPAAAAGLECNDVVTAVGAVTVHTAAELVSAIHAAKPGAGLRMTVRRIGQGGKARVLTVTTRLSGTPASPGVIAKPTVAFLGVAVFTDTTYTLPFDVNIDVGAIGGPSAGLALTLGLIDVLSTGDLTGGHRVAATGTINLDGTVGDVGGVAQKTVAVRKAGAQVFLVPPQEYATARGKAGSMKVYAVSTLEQALTILQSLGGKIPPSRS